MANRTEEVAAEMLGGTGAAQAAPSFASEPPRRRGRPPGSKNRPKDIAPEEPGAWHFQYVADDASIAASTMMGAVVWSLAAPMLKMRDLNKEEREMLGKALDPVLCRWLPIIGNWKFEAALLVTILSLAQTARRDYVDSTKQRTATDSATPQA